MPGTVSVEDILMRAPHSTGLFTSTKQRGANKKARRRENEILVRHKLGGELRLQAVETLSSPGVSLGKQTFIKRNKQKHN